jgi:hypothetical protein
LLKSMIDESKPSIIKKVPASVDWENQALQQVCPDLRGAHNLQLDAVHLLLLSINCSYQSCTYAKYIISLNMVESTLFCIICSCMSSQCEAVISKRK